MVAGGLSVCMQSCVLRWGDIISPTPSLPKECYSPRHRTSFVIYITKAIATPSTPLRFVCPPTTSSQEASLEFRPTGTHSPSTPLLSEVRLQTTSTYTVAPMNTRPRRAMDEFDRLLGIQSPSSCLSFMYQEPEPYLESSNTTASTSPSESPVGNSVDM